VAESGRLSNQELERALHEVAARIDYPPTPDLAVAVRRRIQAQPARRQLPSMPSLTPSRRVLAAALAALVILLAAAGLASSPGLRDAVAQRLGLRGIVITTAPTPTATSTSTGTATAVIPSGAPTPRSATPNPTPVFTPTAVLAPGTPTTLDGARARVPFAILVPDLPALGAPDAVYVDDSTGSPLVTLAYGPRPGFPAAGTTGVAVFLTEFGGSVERPLLQKGLEPGTQVTPVTVDGDPGFWIDGQLHQLAYLDPQGMVQFDTSRLAGNTLVWTHGELTLRLETAISEDRALAVADSLR